MPIPSLLLAFAYNDFEEENVRNSLYTHQGQFYAFLNRDALIDLHFSLHFLATFRNPYEEASIQANALYPPCQYATVIGLCEFNTIKARDVLTEEYQRTGKMSYDAEGDRLDFFLTRAEIRAAYHQVAALARNPQHGQKILLFGGLWLEYVADMYLVER